MKLWVDDLRTPPDDTWTWAKTSTHAIHLLAPRRQVTIMSLDHDLGGDDTARAIVLFLCEHGGWPNEVRVHTANPVGREWLEGMVARYKP
jgi:hypothetical protein